MRFVIHGNREISPKSVMQAYYTYSELPIRYVNYRFWNPKDSAMPRSNEIHLYPQDNPSDYRRVGKEILKKHKQ